MAPPKPSERLVLAREHPTPAFPLLARKTTTMKWVHPLEVIWTTTTMMTATVIPEDQDRKAIQEHRQVHRVSELLRNMLIPVGLLVCKPFEWTISLPLALVLLLLLHF
jgi:hypothetical protein